MYRRLHIQEKRDKFPLNEYAKTEFIMGLRHIWDLPDRGCALDGGSCGVERGHENSII